jgi:hypothetical protein
MRGILIVLAFVSAPSLYAQSLEEQVAEMRTEIRLLRQELNEVKKQLQTQTATVEEIPLLQAQVQEQAQTKMERISYSISSDFQRHLRETAPSFRTLSIVSHRSFAEHSSINTWRPGARLSDRSGTTTSTLRSRIVSES